MWLLNGVLKHSCNCFFGEGDNSNEEMYDTGVCRKAAIFTLLKPIEQIMTAI